MDAINWRKRVRVAESLIVPKENGLFTISAFSKGELIGIMEGHPVGQDFVDEDDTYILWLDDHFPFYVTNEMKYINHNKEDDTNCTVVGLAVYATKDISSGEELSFFYSEDFQEIIEGEFHSKKKLNQDS